MRHSPLTIRVEKGRILIHEDSNPNEPIGIKEVCRPLVQPIIKWAGGKRWLAIGAKHFAPPEWNGRYYEPFVGSAAFFFSLRSRRATIADCNEELIETYRTLCADAREVIRALSRYPYDKQFYYRIRETIPNTATTRAARFLYLNRTCWNGLYRVNQEGTFNTPFGQFDNPTICDSERILTAVKSLKRARIRIGDFAATVSDATTGDFVFFDPPYITGHQNNGFLKYNRRLFSWSDQERLAGVAIKLAESGVHVLVSNADHSTVSNLYRGFYHYKVSRRSLIGGKTGSRGVVTEALLSSYQLLGSKSVRIN